MAEEPQKRCEREAKTSLKNRISRRNATRTAIKHAELKLTARLSNLPMKRPIRLQADRSIFSALRSFRRTDKNVGEDKSCACITATLRQRVG